MADELEVDPNKLEIADELIAERRSEEPGQTPETMTSWQRPITASIDVLNLWVGRITCLLLVPIIAAMVYEGWIILETPATNNPLAAAKANLKFTRELLGRK